MVKKKEESLSKIKFKNFVKKNEILITVFVVILILAGLSILMAKPKVVFNENKIYGDDVIEMYYFHLTTCPHCIEQNKFMDKVLFNKYPNLRIHRFEMTKKESYLKYKEMAKSYNGLDPAKFPGTPLSIIGDKYNIGFGTELTTGPKIISMVEAEQKKIEAKWNSSMKRTVDLLSTN